MTYLQMPRAIYYFMITVEKILATTEQTLEAE